MPTKNSGPVRQVVAQDRAASVARAFLAGAALVLASSTRPGLWLAFVLLFPLGLVLVGLWHGPYQSARAWVADLSSVPRLGVAVAPATRAVVTGLALGAVGGLVLLVLVLIVRVDSPGEQSILSLPAGIVFVRAWNRLLITRAVSRWEREQGVVLCRGRASSWAGLELFHEADVERMVAVPVGS